MTPDQVSDWRKESLIDSKRMELERAVIEACRVRHDAESDRSDAAYRGSKCVVEDAALQQANCDLRVAMLALIEFETEHGLMTLERK